MGVLIQQTPALLSSIHIIKDLFTEIISHTRCISSGKDLPDAISQITDAASNWLCVAEDEKLTISDPTPQAMIIRDSEDVISLIQVDTTEYRAATENHTVRINVTLPAWMANFADKRN